MRFSFAVCVFLAGTATAFCQEFDTFEDHLISQFQVENFGESYGAAEQNKAREINDITIGLIKDFEGWRPSAYNDPVGYCTIGYGHLIALDRCENIDLKEFVKPISEARGLEILKADTIGARLTVGKLVDNDLDDNEFGGLVSFVFNVGSTNFEKSTLLKLLNDGEKSAAAKQFRRWVKAKGIVLPGLVTRRACEELLFGSDLLADSSGNFDRKNCEVLGAAPGAGVEIDIYVGE